MDTYEVRDGARILSFSGIVLAAASSQRKSAPRWTELVLYQTVSNAYVLEKIGRSTVTHMPGCPEIIGTLPRFQTEHPGDDPDTYDYHECVPEVYDFTKLLVEQNRYWALVSDDPEEVVEALKIKKRTGREHMPKLSAELLDLVSKVDERFRNTSWQRVQYI